MFLYLLAIRLTIIAVILVCLALFTTVYLNRKKTRVLRYLDELDRVYNEFVHLLNRDEYFSLRDFHRWREKCNPIENIVKDYVRFKNKANRWAKKGGLLSSLLRNYVDHFSIERSLDVKIRSLENIFEKGPEIVKTRNENFIKTEMMEHADDFENIGPHKFTDKQTRSIIIDEAYNLVVSAAGSGKDRLISGKVRYLLKKGLAKPEEMLVLSFEEDKAGLSDKIEDLVESSVKVSSFICLGLEIVSESSGEEFRVSELSTDPNKLKLSIEGFLKERIQDIDFLNHLNKYFLYYLYPAQRRGGFDSAEDYRRYVSGIELRSLQGERVANLAQLEIANYLLLNGIEYEYKKEYVSAGDESRDYRPDFYLSEYNTWIEYFKIDENNQVGQGLEELKYLDEMEWKRQVHLESYTDLVETYEFERDGSTLLGNLREKLDVRGVSFERSGPDELYSKLDSLGSMHEFVSLLAKFLSLYKSSGLSISDLKDRVDGTIYNERYEAFLHVFTAILEDYTAYLKEDKSIDLNELLDKATNQLKAGAFPSPYKYIILDNFQDISQREHKLLKSLLDQSPDSKLFCVGDDWQSIGSLRGGDLSLMMNFEGSFDPSEEIFLDKSFRFGDKICRFTSEFIQGNPYQNNKDLRGLEEEEGEIYLVWYEDEHEALKDTINRIREGDNGKVLVVGRYDEKDYDALDFDVVRVGALLEDPDLDIEYLKAYDSRGQESDYVILVEVRSGRLGFPSEIEDDSVLDLVRLKDENYPYAEERRLFYVAATRARKGVYVLADKRNPSPFSLEIMKGKYDLIELGEPP